MLHSPKTFVFWKTPFKKKRKLRQDREREKKGLTDISENSYLKYGRNAKHDKKTNSPVKTRHNVWRLRGDSLISAQRWSVVPPVRGARTRTAQEAAARSGRVSLGRVARGRPRSGWRWLGRRLPSAGPSAPRAAASRPLPGCLPGRTEVGARRRLVHRRCQQLYSQKPKTWTPIPQKLKGQSRRSARDGTWLGDRKGQTADPRSGGGLSSVPPAGGRRWERRLGLRAARRRGAPVTPASSFRQSTRLVGFRAEASSSVGGLQCQSRLHPWLCWVRGAGPLRSVSGLGGDLNPSTQ